MMILLLLLLLLLRLLLLKQACNFFQFIQATSRKIEDQYLTHDLIKSRAIQFQAFKDTDSKEVGGLPKLTVNMDVLSWMDRTEKHLRKIPGVDFYHLAYFLRETEVVPVTTVAILPDKCYSVTDSSMIEKCGERKSQRNTCAETDRVTLFGYLEAALIKGPLESVLQPHESTKGGQAIINEKYLQQGGRSKWENAHHMTMVQLKSSNGTKTLTNHIAAFWVNMMDIKRYCKRTGCVDPSVREQALWLVGSITTANVLLVAHITAINGDPNGLANNF